jgi:hypothetical protein
MCAKKRADSSADESVADLTAAVDALRDEVRVLRESIDEFRTDFVHLLRNLPDNLPPPYQHLTTLAEAVEATEGESPPAQKPVHPVAVPRRPGHLFWFFSVSLMPKEAFLYPETKPVFDLIEEASRRSGVSRAQAFEDFLHMSVCALSGGLMEEQYLATVKKHSDGKKGKRGCDSIAHAFGRLVDAMEKTRLDILGDVFQGGITYGEAGQFMSPECICDMMARMTVDGADIPVEERKTVHDPCCGSGRMLLAVAKINPHWEFIGQDVDLRSA